MMMRVSVSGSGSSSFAAFFAVFVVVLQESWKVTSFLSSSSMITTTTRHTNYNRLQILKPQITTTPSLSPPKQLSSHHFVSLKTTTLLKTSTQVGSNNKCIFDDDGDDENNNKHITRITPSSSRRSFVSNTLMVSAAGAAALVTASSFVDVADAFPNAMQPEYKKYADRPKRKGTPPKDLGVLPRTIETADDGPVTSPKLRSCDGNPNCFSTTGDELLSDRQQYGVDYYIPEWQPPSPDNNNSNNNKNSNNPIETIAEVMTTYEPGQGGIDGGGYILVKKSETYLYYQFESLKKGYIDDLEFAIVAPSSSKNNKASGVMVRSASRLGVTDFGVNAIRLNYIASKLKGYGWTIPDITPETHRDYWITAEEAREATFDEDRRRLEK